MYIGLILAYFSFIGILLSISAYISSPLSVFVFFLNCVV